LALVTGRGNSKEGIKFGFTPGFLVRVQDLGSLALGEECERVLFHLPAFLAVLHDSVGVPRTHFDNLAGEVHGQAETDSNFKL